MESYNNAGKNVVSLIKIAQKYSVSLGIFNYTKIISDKQRGKIQEDIQYNTNKYTSKYGYYELFLTWV